MLMIEPPLVNRELAIRCGEKRSGEVGMFGVTNQIAEDFFYFKAPSARQVSIHQ